MAYSKEIETYLSENNFKVKLLILLINDEKNILVTWHYWRGKMGKRNIKKIR